MAVKILFVLDKWCAADLKFGISEWETNMWQSFETTGLGSYEKFHMDEYYHTHKEKGDKALLDKIETYAPDIICMIIYRMPGSDPSVPDWETLKSIRDKYETPVVNIWGDLEIPEQIQIAKALQPYVTLNYATASTAALKRINMPEKFFYIWVPKNPTIFNDPGKNRNVDLSYLGSMKKDRISRIGYLKDNGIDVYRGGGEREQHLSTIQYADVFQRSKITLSFSRGAYSHVINARPFEAMLCGTMVLEQENFETPKLYIPYVDYVPYSSNRDLLEKCNYYLEHNEERETIARNGLRQNIESVYGKNILE